MTAAGESRRAGALGVGWAPVVVTVLLPLESLPPGPPPAAGTEEGVSR